MTTLARQPYKIIHGATPAEIRRADRGLKAFLATGPNSLDLAAVNQLLEPATRANVREVLARPGAKITVYDPAHGLERPNLAASAEDVLALTQAGRVLRHDAMLVDAGRGVPKAAVTLFQRATDGQTLAAVDHLSGSRGTSFWTRVADVLAHIVRK